ncbi:uncharacterized protein LOC105424845, partial [Pogonomyrmex barbatus]|uniref:Uncharacterized protein LOC105424845 n=1 Tax=Pogonomyrmex barbatus TaxID=144034 RepID=A0A6I9WP79_9HYME
FLMYTVGGIWRPIEWSSSGAKLLYSIFTFIIVLSEYFLVLTQFMDIIFVVNNIDDFATNTLMFFTIVAVCCKATVVVLRRNAIINLVKILLEAPYKPRDEGEIAIQTKFDKFIKSCSIKYSLLATCSITGLTLGSVLNVMHGHLPYRIWLPWDYHVPMRLWIISIHQILTVIFAAIINVGTETLVFGLFIQTCAQLEIFENRLHKLIINNTIRYLERALSSSSENRRNISECIYHHLCIYKYAKTVNVIFNEVLFVQFFGSILVLCTSVYFLSMHITELSAIANLLVYTICMFVQIFVYCWSGNEVILKSTNVGETVYRMNWPLLPVNEKKALLMIMMRSTIPIKFTSSFLITLSLQSYSNVSTIIYCIGKKIYICRIKKIRALCEDFKNIILSIQRTTKFSKCYTCRKVFNFLCSKLSVIMQLLTLNFLIYTVAGIWRPIEWSSNGAKLLYNIFTSVILFLEYFLVISQFMDILLVVDNVDDFVANSLMFASIVAVTSKATLVVIRRNAIVKLVQMLLTIPCKPQDESEEVIQTKFDKFIRSWSIRYLLLAMSSLTSVTLRSVLNVIEGQLPYRVWIPYDFNIPLVFWMVSIQQIIALIFATFINVGTETLVFGLFLQTCAQFEIFENRLYKFVSNKTVKLKHSFISPIKEKSTISEYIHHHLSIYKYAKTLNIIFNQVLFIQFFSSILILCTSVFYMSTHISESGTMTLLIYTICMFVQIYVYCWSGNEVMLKSTSIGDAIYDLDWPSLSISERKELLMIMMRSTIPIKFTSSFLITISLQSYSNILKASYSAFNLLQR